MLVFERMLVFAEVDARVYGARSPAFGCGAEPTPGGMGARVHAALWSGETATPECVTASWQSPYGAAAEGRRGK